jgi:hypothetical protein
MRDTAYDIAAIAADAVALAELHGGTGNERVRIEWLQRRLADAPGSRRVDDALGCCEGADMHAPGERIRADTIAAGAAQLRAVLAEILEGNP